MHALCSHHSHRHSHRHHHSMPIPPYVHFKEEPATVADQFRAMGGEVIRHDFAPRSYNPGLTENRFFPNFPWLRADYLMTFRSQEVVGGISVSSLSLCGVKTDGKIRWIAPLDLPPIPGIGVAMQEDGRLFWFHGKLFLAYSNVRLRESEVTFKQSLVELIPVLPSDMANKNYAPVFTVGPMKGLNFGSNDHAHATHEKNWQFFEDNAQLAFVYSIHPHVVTTPASMRSHLTSSLATADWTLSWGEMHGGTPPIKLPDGSFLSFFNSFVRHADHQRRYSIGAYTFAGSSERYRITRVIDRPLVIGSERDGFLWESPTYWEPIVAFATGASFDGKDTIRLAYGVNDCYAETATLSLSKLLAGMASA